MSTFQAGGFVSRLFSSLSDPVWVARSPIIAQTLLEAANVQQLVQMWLIDHSADGQSVTAWASVQAALWIWYNFYRVLTPQAHWAIWGARVGIGLNMAVILSVLYWRM